MPASQSHDLIYARRVTGAISADEGLATHANPHTLGGIVGEQALVLKGGPQHRIL